MRLSGISEAGIRRIAQSVSIDEVVEVGQEYRSLYDSIETPSREQDYKLRDLDKAFKDGIEGLLSEMLKEYPGTDISSNYDATSKYFDIGFELEDESQDIYERDSIEVRVSNHGQKYSGPVYSFETGDDRSTIEYGLGVVREALEELIETVTENFESAQGGDEMSRVGQVLSDYGLLGELFRYRGRGLAWRVQPKGVGVEGYSSMDYEGSGELGGGVWAFTDVVNLFDDEGMESELEYYANQVIGDGAEPELVGLSYESSGDGPGGSIIVYGGRIEVRLDALGVLAEYKELLEDLEGEIDWDEIG